MLHRIEGRVQIERSLRISESRHAAKWSCSLIGDLMNLSRRFLAELLGTFWLVFAGCGSAVISAAFPQVGIGLVGVALAFGLSVLTMGYAIGHISGFHL